MEPIVLSPGLVKLEKDSPWQFAILQRESLGDNSVKTGYLVKKDGTLTPIKAKNVWSFRFLDKNCSSDSESVSINIPMVFGKYNPVQVCI